MNQVSLPLRSLANRIRTFDANEVAEIRAQTVPLFPAVAKLFVRLKTLMGQSGSDALLRRALSLAAADVPWLAELRVLVNGELKRSEVALGTVDSVAFADAEAVFLAQLISLLVALIGPTLTLRLLRDAWPSLPCGYGDFYHSHDHEEPD